MSNDKKAIEKITSMDEDFGQWYTDIVKQAGLVDYTSVKGCVVICPYGYAIWEHIQRILDSRFKETGHENVYLPLFIPEGLLNREKDHVEGFAPEVAWVTQGGAEELTERLCVRPTSETLFCEHYKNAVQSWRDLPKLYNQWCNVVRWEKTTRPFLRSREFLWQEGHTLHATPEEATEETLRILDLYADFCEKVLAMPVIRGRKTDSDKFAGAEATYAIEAMMHDGKALQAGTSHYFGDGFARAFDITYTTKENKLAHPYQTSWGVTTRLIGAIIMTHGDDRGLNLPPMVAPVQAVIIPVAQHKEGVLDACKALEEKLKSVCRVKLDASDNSPGWKFAEHEMRGVPVRIELGPRDIENGECVLGIRYSGEKRTVKSDELERILPALLDEITQGMFDKALENRTNRTYSVKTLDEIDAVLKEKDAFFYIPWCEDPACENAIKEQTGVGSRCIPFDQHAQETDVCPVCGKKAKHIVLFAKAY